MAAASAFKAVHGVVFFCIPEMFFLSIGDDGGGRQLGWADLDTFSTSDAWFIQGEVSVFSNLFFLLLGRFLSLEQS